MLEWKESVVELTENDLGWDVIIAFRSRISISDQLMKINCFYQLHSTLVLMPTVKLSTLPREKELLSLDQNTKESRLPNVRVLEFIVEVPARSTNIL